MFLSVSEEDAASTSETLATVFKNTGFYIPKDQASRTPPRESPGSQAVNIFIAERVIV